MNESALTQIFLPLALALIMFGMGLSLTRADFGRLLKMPRPILVGLFGQMIVMPLIAFALALVLELQPKMAIGLMILAACPGGATSNLFSHIARANLALSISLTAIGSAICVLTTPLLIMWSIGYFAADDVQRFSLLQTTLGLIVITLVPVMIGMTVKRFAETFADRAEPFFRRLSMVFFIAIVGLVIHQSWDMLLEYFSQYFFVTLALSALTILAGLGLGRLFSLPPVDRLTLGIEVGIQNATVAILVAVSFIKEPEYAIAGAIYGITMYLGTGVLVFISQRQRKA